MKQNNINEELSPSEIFRLRQIIRNEIAQLLWDLYKKKSIWSEDINGPTRMQFIKEHINKHINISHFLATKLKEKAKLKSKKIQKYRELERNILS